MSQTTFQGQPAYQLQNGDSVCRIAPQFGARLLDWKIGNQAIIHWPQDANWDDVPHIRGGNPILFPFIGRHAVDHKIGFWRDSAGVVRELPMHGFAKDLPFEIIEATETRLQMQLVSNAATRAMYPFEFEFDVIYELGETTLKSTFVTKNTGQESLPYYAGHHFYLDIPHEERAQWQLHLPCERWGRQDHSDFLMYTTPATSADTTLANPGIVDRMHLELKEPKVLLRNGEREITFSWSDADPWMDVTTWTESDEADFYCVEPWLGLPDAIHHGFGIRHLDAGATESVSCEITVD